MIGIILPFTLELLGISSRIITLSYVGNFLILAIIVITIIDLGLILVKGKNLVLLVCINLGLVISAFLILEFCFLNDYFSFAAVYSYSNSALPGIYKAVAIWAGEEGSILTWLLLNSIVVTFYRIKHTDESDPIFQRSLLITMGIYIAFWILLYFLNPFTLLPFTPGDGLGLNELLQSPYMIIHPLFVFLGYAIFLIPFAVTIAELLTSDARLQSPYQRKFLSFAFKFGWLVITLGIGIGAYWASLTSSWGRYWAWDPIETVSLLPWLLCTAYFHSMAFKKEKRHLVQFTVILIFLTNIFATLLTRSPAGLYGSQHAFTGGEIMVVFLLMVGFIILAAQIYIIYTILDIVLEEYEGAKKLFDYLSYLFLALMAFIFMFGLIVPPLTDALSTMISIDKIVLSPGFYVLGGLIFGIGLAISLTFCSLLDYASQKRIILFILIGFLAGLGVTLIIYALTSIFINPLISIFGVSFIAALYHLSRGFKGNGLKKFFRRNAKVIIHVGISFLLLGTMTTILPILQNLFFIGGFIIILIGIVPSVLLPFFIKSTSTDTE